MSTSDEFIRREMPAESLLEFINLASDGLLRSFEQIGASDPQSIVDSLSSQISNNDIVGISTNNIPFGSNFKGAYRISATNDPDTIFVQPRNIETLGHELLHTTALNGGTRHNDKLTQKVFDSFEVDISKSVFNSLFKKHGVKADSAMSALTDRIFGAMLK